MRERIEPPDQSAAIGTERDDRECRGRRIEDAVHHDRRGLDLAGSTLPQIAGMVDPRDPQLCDVGRIDLSQRRVPRISRVAPGDAPVDRLKCRGRAAGNEGEDPGRPHSACRG